MRKQAENHVHYEDVSVLLLSFFLSFFLFVPDIDLTLFFPGPALRLGSRPTRLNQGRRQAIPQADHPSEYAYQTIKCSRWAIYQLGASTYPTRVAAWLTRRKKARRERETEGEKKEEASDTEEKRVLLRLQGGFFANLDFCRTLFSDYAVPPRDSPSSPSHSLSHTHAYLPRNSKRLLERLMWTGK